MRIVKDPDVRRTEILDTAQQLFTTKGYEKTTIMDILGAIGIAKGTFYYYFKSKEEVMEGVITRLIEADVLAASRLLEDNSLSTLEKFSKMLLGQQPRRGDQKDKILEQFHQPNNARMHQRSLVLGIQGMAPVLAKVVEEGIAQGLFATPFPRETVELLLASSQVLFDDGMFQWQAQERRDRARAFVALAEGALCAGTGSFSFLLEMLAPEKAGETD